MPRAEGITLSPKEVNILYTVCMLFFIICGEVLQRANPPALSYEQKMGLITAAQICFVFIPTILFLYIKRLNIKYILKLNKISIVNAILSFFIILFAMPVTMFINFFWMLVVQYIGKLHIPIDIPMDKINMIGFNLLIIAVVPAIFEELLFRGVILSGYKKTGALGAIIITSLLFALMHRDLQTLVGTFLLGMLIAYIVYRTNSIFAGIIGHFANNGTAVLLMYLAIKAKEYILAKSPPDIVETIRAQTETKIAGITPEQIIPTIIVMGSIALFFGIFLAGALIIFRNTTADSNRETTYFEKQKIDKTLIYQLIPSLLLVGYAYYKQIIT